MRIGVQYLASDLGFEPKSFTTDGHIVRIGFSTRYPGTSQTEEIFLGGKKWGRRLQQKVEYVDLLVIEQLLGLLQKTQIYWDGYSEIQVRVSDYDDKPLGEVLVNVSTIPKLEGPSKLPLAQARTLLKIDTLGDAKMNYRVAHQPIDF